jgi:hypothetical protein
MIPLQLVDFLESFLDSPPQIRITHVGVGIDWLVAHLIRMECTGARAGTYMFLMNPVQSSLGMHEGDPIFGNRLAGKR